MIVYRLSDDINHITMHGEFAEILVRKKENVYFYKHFSNMDISLNIQFKALRFSTYTYQI